MILFNQPSSWTAHIWWATTLRCITRHFKGLRLGPDVPCCSEKKLLTIQLMVHSNPQGSILAFFQTRHPGKYIRKDTCPDKILLAHSKLHNNLNTVKNLQLTTSKWKACILFSLCYCSSTAARLLSNNFILQIQPQTDSTMDNKYKKFNNGLKR